MKKKVYHFIFYLLLIIGSITLAARYIGTKGLIVKEYAIVNAKLPDSFDGIKIIQFSDLHYGSIIYEKELKALVNKINILKPDIVFFTGDLVEKSYDLSSNDKQILENNLNKIDAVIGKYAVSGNHDYDYDGYSQIITTGGFKLLDNDTISVYYKTNEPIIIKGCSSTLKTKPNFDSLFTDNEIIKDKYVILLAHEPDVLTKVGNYSIDLMLSGHSHGGQVVIPFIGPIITTKGAKTYYEAHYLVDETELYISSGLGTSGYRLRLFNKPSFNLYRLYKK